MGAWDELDTEINVTVDTSELDELLEICGGSDIYEPLEASVNRLKKGLTDGSKEAVKDIARRNKSFQEQLINIVCDNPSGRLMSSITAEKQNDFTYLVGTRITEIYPMSVEYGRREVYPKRAKALAFYLDGELVFRKKVGRAEPRPFVAPAYETTKGVAEEIMLRKVEIAKRRM